MSEVFIKKITQMIDTMAQENLIKFHTIKITQALLLTTVQQNYISETNF